MWGSGLTAFPLSPVSESRLTRLPPSFTSFTISPLKPMVPFWAKCTSILAYFRLGCSLGVRDFDPWPFDSLLRWAAPPGQSTCSPVGKGPRGATFGGVPLCACATPPVGFVECPFLGFAFLGVYVLLGGFPMLANVHDLNVFVCVCVFCRWMNLPEFKFQPQSQPLPSEFCLNAISIFLKSSQPKTTLCLTPRTSYDFLIFGFLPACPRRF